MAEDDRPVRVFISYSHDSDAHRDRVAALADRLRGEGVDAWIDQYEPHPDEGWPRWMKRQLSESDYVLLVCTPTYRRRFDGEAEPGQGRGVTWEAGLVQQDLYDAGGRNARAIPVLFEGGSEVDIPMELRRFTHYGLWRGYDDLYRHLTTQPKRTPRSLGPKRSMPSDEPGAPDDGFGEYRRQMRSMHESLRLLGFDERVRVRIQLEDLYVPLDVVLEHGSGGRVVHSDAHLAKLHLAKAGREASGLDHRRVSMAEAFTLVRERAGKRGVVLLGDPGSGKTTQLRRMLLQLLSEDDGGPEAVGLPADTLPVFLPLQQVAAMLPDDELHGVPHLDLAVVIQRELTRVVDWAPGDHLGEQLVGRRRLLLLLDGLDEVADERERGRIARWIEEVLLRLPNSYALVSCRYAGYAKDVRLDDPFLDVHLRPLTEQQIETFVRNWYREVREREAELGLGAPEPGNPGDLLAELRSPDFRGEPRLFQMSTNPLLLTALCLVHRQSGRLPRSREALYRECVNALLDGSRRRRGVDVLADGLGAEPARRVLQRVALWMHGEEERTQASADELLGSVKEGFEVVGHLEGDPMAFLTSIRNQSGLLTGWDVDLYGFMHLGLQEYLAALELRGRPEEDRALRELAASFGESWWQEVILLMLADGDAAVFERFMGLVAEHEGFVSWARSPMMVRVLAEPTEAMARPFVALLEREPGPDDDGLARRQLAAAQLLGRRMPKVLDDRAEMLAKHASSQVRTWWERWQTLLGRHVKTTVSRRGGVELVRIPGGTFMMGSPDDDEMAYDDEKPQHPVTLAAFELARTPVTNAQYGEYLAANPDAPRPEYWGTAEYGQPDQPVVGVSWDEAMAYCEWAGLTLPTEAQWEYACRANAKMHTRYHSGDTEEDLARAGWYDGNSDNRLHAVAELEPNDFGLYDMHGNVLEWCRDAWVGGYSDLRHEPGDGLHTQPVGDAKRVVRGGDWGLLGVARSARSAVRDGDSPGFRDRILGLRPARVIP
ncbi:MAG: SUMF1/EgtB/PvdO family nonheme iron enzyme [Nannocystaceae bacterium]